MAIIFKAIMIIIIHISITGICSAINEDMASSPVLHEVTSKFSSYHPIVLNQTLKKITIIDNAILKDYNESSNVYNNKTILENNGINLSIAPPNETMENINETISRAYNESFRIFKMKKIKTKGESHPEKVVESGESGEAGSESDNPVKERAEAASNILDLER